jgi:hypothetical protein
MSLYSENCEYVIRYYLQKGVFRLRSRYFVLLMLLAMTNYALANDEDWASSTLAPNMENFCEVQRGQRVVNSKRLLLWLIDLVGISDTAMDLDGDGNTLYNEKTTLIADEAALLACIESGRCDSLDQNKVRKVQEIISSLWGVSPPNIFTNPFTTRFLPGFEDSASVINLASFLSPESGVESLCPPPELLFPDPERESLLTEPGEAVEEKVVVEDARHWSEFILLRESSDDIIKLFSEAAPASLSLEGNEDSDTRDIEIDLVVAYLYDESFYEKFSAQYYAYTQFDTDIVRIDGKETDSSRNAVTLGILAEYKLGKYDDQYFANHIITLRPSYTSDIIQKTRTANIITTWSPIPNLGDNNFVLKLTPVNSFINFKLSGDLRIEGGRVLNEGNVQVFEGNDTYIDFGYNFNLLFTGRKNSALERFQWDTNYKKLHATLSDQPDKEYISSKLRYYFNGNFNVGLEYERGRKGVQFNSVDTWELTFGAKF